MESRGGAGFTGETLQDLFGLGEAPFLVLRKEELAVHGHVENAASAVDEDGIDSEFLLDGGRETRSPWLIVSNHAILDGDVHRKRTWTRGRGNATPSRAPTREER
jgi:hypothetical protein